MLTGILNDFLSLGRIEEGKIQVRPVEFNVEECISSIASEMRDTLKKQQIISYDHQGDKIVTLDPSLFKQIVHNLLTNASKFSPESSTIDVRTSVHDDTLKLMVQDQGMGISREDQKHLMERFFRGSNVANIQGTGLGLHIISKYAELMNGTVEFESELEKGTKFIITFNLKDQ